MKFGKRVLSTLIATSLLASGTIAGIFTSNAAVATESVSAEADLSTVSSGSQGPQNSIGGSAILHCFDWSYNAIKENLDDIKAAGYTAVQTSPVQPAKDYNASWTDQGGQWWKLYQPIDISVADTGQTWLGSKAELKALCDAAEEKGIKVVCDIVANHMANISGTGNHMNDIHSSVSATLRNNSSYWHINDIWANDGSRYDMTQGSIGEPDLNTGNSYIQQRYKDLLTELIGMGVDGFRFDAAKHIELPTDSGCASNFWPTVIDGSRASTSNEIFYYGEILNSMGTSASNYTKYMSITDNYSGDATLVAANSYNASSLANSNYSKGAGDSKSVIWVESHDTYMGDSGSAGLRNTKGVSSNTVIKAWAIVGSRANSTALYFARPAATMGSASTDTSWKSTSVSEVNKFKNYFDGQSEYLSSSGNVAYNERGTSGVVISKLDGGGSVNLAAHKMADGTYTDQVSGNKFTVSGGNISGTVGSSGVAVVYNPEPEGPTASVTPGSSTYKTDTLTLTLKYENATSGQYSIDGGAYTSFTSGQTITIGSGADYGTKTTVSVKASDGSKTSDAVTYTYTKVDPTAVQTVHFDNSSYNWSSVYAYIYSESGSSVVENSAWPGVQMTKDSSGYYSVEVPENLENGYVIFTESYSATTNRYPADGEDGMALSGRSMLFGANHSWTEYTAQQTTTVKPSTTPTTATSATTATTATVATTPVGNILIGDVNFDGEITIDDATEIQRYIASIIVPENVDFTAAADTDGDGDITILDVTTIQYYLIGNTAKQGKTGQYTGQQTTTEPVTVEPTTVQPVADEYIYFKNNSGWNNVTAYYWSDANTTMTSWPGKAMEKMSDNVYRISVPEDAEKVIFSNNGSSQTEDLTIAGYGYIYDNGNWSKYSGGSQSSTTQPTTTQPATSATDTYTIKLTNNYSWSTVSCYYWSDSNTTMTSWPGASMTFDSTNDFGQSIYTITIPSSATHIIFNNGGNGQQTVDINVTGSANYYISGGSGSNCTVETW